MSTRRARKRKHEFCVSGIKLAHIQHIQHIILCKLKYTEK